MLVQSSQECMWQGNQASLPTYMLFLNEEEIIVLESENQFNYLCTLAGSTIEQVEVGFLHL